VPDAEEERQSALNARGHPRSAAVAELVRGESSLRTLIVALLLVCALIAPGCSPGDGEGEPFDEVAASSKSLLGSTLPMRVTPAFWTAIWVSPDGSVSSQATPSGWLCMCAVNPQKVTQAILICTRESKPSLDAVRQQMSSAQRVDGVLQAFERTDLVNEMKRANGVDLLVDAQGRPLYLVVSHPVAASTASPLPVTAPPPRLLERLKSASPSPLSSPLSSPSSGGVR